jgi:hypothetical protein
MVQTGIFLFRRPAGADSAEKWLQLEEFLHDELVGVQKSPVCLISVFMPFFFSHKLEDFHEKTLSDHKNDKVNICFLGLL